MHGASEALARISSALGPVVVDVVVNVIVDGDGDGDVNGSSSPSPFSRRIQALVRRLTVRMAVERRLAYEPANRRRHPVLTRLEDAPLAGGAFLVGRA